MDKFYNIGQNLSYQNQNNVDAESNERLNNFYEKGLSAKSTPQKKAHTQTNNNTFLNKIKSFKPSILYDTGQKKETTIIYQGNISINKSRSNSKDNPDRSRSQSKEQIDQREKRAKTPIKQESLNTPFKEIKKGKMIKITSYNNLTLVEKNKNENILYDANTLIENENDDDQFNHDDIRKLEEVLSNYQNYEHMPEPPSENADMTLTGQTIPKENMTEVFTVIKLSN